MYLPEDPDMLYSLVNMKLRDQFADLDDLCCSMDIDQDELLKRLASAGYTYSQKNNRFI